jgi:hypothetical protein
MYNQEYLDQIAKKLDSFNKINGVNPEANKQLSAYDNFDIFSSLGNSAIKYMEAKKDPKQAPIDPLFTDHNTHLR